MINACLLLLLFTLHPRYHTFEETISEVERLKLINPSIVLVETLGYTSVLNLPIISVKISDNPSIHEPEPSFLFVGVHHAEEVLGLEVSLYTMERFVINYGIDSLITKIVNETQLWFIPLLNADGHRIVTEGIDTTWRKNLRDNNNNGTFNPDSDGVDLNRNYSFNWSLGGSDDPTSEYYRGPAPFSENETRVIQDLAERERFVMAIDFHSARTGQGEIVYYPWRWGGTFCVDLPFIRSIAQLLAGSIQNDAGTGTYAHLYGLATEGNFRNFLYANYGTYAYTIEISWGCIPPGERVDSICERVYHGLIQFINRIFGPGIALQISDEQGNPIEAEVKILGYYDSNLPRRTSDPANGMFWKLLTPGIYDIEITKDGFETIYLHGVTVSDTLIFRHVIIPTPKIFEHSKDNHFFISYYESGIALKLINLFPCDATEINVVDATGRVLKKFFLEGKGDSSPILIKDLPSPGIFFLVIKTCKKIMCKPFIWVGR
ncbi:MAG: M14 family zinc carboxypeptidase [candidate division WOR-3 bacterium]